MQGWSLYEMHFGVRLIYAYKMLLKDCKESGHLVDNMCEEVGVI
jgi:hypothetical protein